MKLSKFLTEKMIDKETARSMFANFCIKGLSFILTYLYVPLLLRYLGNEKYGLWAVILSVTTWINLCDIGIGGGLRNILTGEISEEKKEEAQQSVSTAYVVLSFLSLTTWLVLLFVTLFISWNHIFNTNLNINYVMLISSTFICINFVLSLVNVILYALQVSEQVALVNLLGNVINILGMFILQQFSAGCMECVALVYGISTFVPLLFNNFRIFRRYVFLRPRIRKFDKTKMHSLLLLGITFFILQIGGIMLTTTDNIIISQLFGMAEVTPIEITNKLLSIVKGFYMAMIIPVWARTAKAVFEKDFVWLNKMYKQLLLLLGVFGGGIILLIVLFRHITIFWLGKEIDISLLTIIIIGICTFADIASISYSSMLSGMGRIKIQIFIAVIQIIVNIPLSIFFAQNMDMGVMGVILTTAILFAFSGVVYAFYTKYYINKLCENGSD